MTLLNPNHPVSQAVENSIHTILSMVVLKCGGHIVLTMADLNALTDKMACAVYEDAEGFHLEIISKDRAHELAKANGGLPQ